ncbi:MAG: hypothetical protein KatS3mg105_3527 [Gemmatales bacterium]|nr:MAG: hypothetical protein KatS3mg105_3527 [Gemmatales bacterium]
MAGLKAGIDAASHPHEVLYEIPFDSERKAMSIVFREPDGHVWMYTKGAPEVILAKCTRELHEGREIELTSDRRRVITEAAAAMADRALRVLGLAYRRDHAGPDGVYREEAMVFAGLAGMIDPPREEARDAVQRCCEAGIRPVMITGDHPATARAIARELGILRPNDRLLTGQELDALSDDDLADRVEEISVYARVAAEHKLRVVKAWKRQGHVVAMTGDGVNDAPAVRSADIGIAMGKTGTDVTRDASAMVLTDDNFASIVNAVEEGRCVYDNIQKVLRFLLSCNLGEILIIFLASLFAWPTPLIAIQLLWINLVTDGLPALALSMEKPEPGIMRRKPRSPKESILSAGAGFWILLQGLLQGGVVLAAFALMRALYPEELGRARTIAFCVLVYTELFRALAARSPTLTLFQLGVFTNPPLLGAIVVSGLLQFSVVTMPFARPVFESATHFVWEWALILVFSLIPVTMIEMVKWVKMAFSRSLRDRIPSTF